MENCYKHLDNEAIGICEYCQRPICEACHLEYDEKNFCSNFCISDHKKSKRSELFAHLTSFKIGAIYFGFFLLSVYLMFIVYRFQQGAMTMKSLWPHAIAYMVLGLILGLIFLIVSVTSTKD